MRKENKFERLKAFVVAQGYSLTQLENVTQAQAENVLGVSFPSVAFFENVRRLLVGDKRIQDEQQVISGLVASVGSTIKAAFPEVAYERNKSIDGDECIILWTNGRPASAGEIHYG